MEEDRETRTDEDVEAHKLKAKTKLRSDEGDGDDVEAHKLKLGSEEADVEAHRMKGKAKL